MTQAIGKEQIILDKLHTLNSHQQQEVLDFIEFLCSRTQQQPLIEEDNQNSISFLEAAEEFVGCVEGNDEPQFTEVPTIQSDLTNETLDPLDQFIGAIYHGNLAQSIDKDVYE